MDKRKTAWVSLYNCLYVTSSKYKDIAHLESRVFEIFEDLDSAILVGLEETTLSFFIEQEWITSELKTELASFRDHLNAIPSKNWNADDFDHLEDWKLVREWSVALMQKLKMDRRGWNSDGTAIIYTE